MSEQTTDFLIATLPILAVLAVYLLSKTSSTDPAEIEHPLLRALVRFARWFAGSNKAQIDQQYEDHDEKIGRWNAMAEALGLERVDDYPSTRLEIAGQVDGVDVSLRRGPGHDGNSVTMIEVDVSEVVPERFALERQLTSEFVVSLGVVNREDIYVGDERLDRAFTFHARSERQLRDFVWREGVEEALLKLIDFPDATYIQEGTLTIAVPGRLPSADDGVELVRRTLALVEELRAALAHSEQGAREPISSDAKGWQEPS